MVQRKKEEQKVYKDRYNILIIEQNPYDTMVWCYRDLKQPPTYLHVQYQLLRTSSSAVGGSFILHTSEFRCEIERKDWWARTKPISLLQCTGEKMFLYMSLSVCSAKAFCGHVPTPACKVNHFSYSLYIAQTRYTKYWSIRGVCVSHPTLPTTSK